MTTDNLTDDFSRFGLSEEIVDVLVQQRFVAATLLQQLAIPAVLDGRDVVGHAANGSGKTTAYVVSTLGQIDPEVQQPQVCVLAPTRESTSQIAELFRLYAQHLPDIQIASIIGGEGYGMQISQLKRGAQVVVGTPSRLIDLVREENLLISQLRSLVLDDADELLKLGFGENVKWILSAAEGDPQTLMFSASMPESLRELAEHGLREPERIELADVLPTPALNPIEEANTADAADEMEEISCEVAVEEEPPADEVLANSVSGDVPDTESAPEVLERETSEVEALESESVEKEINGEATAEDESPSQPEKATRPIAKDPVGELKKRLANIIADDDLDESASMLTSFLAENPNTTMLQLSSALARLALEWATAGELPKPRARRRDERPERRESSFRNRSDRPARGRDNRDSRERRFDRKPAGRDGGNRGSNRSPQQGMAKYRIEVGHDHGVRPGNIVGAITGSSDIKGWQIGGIDIQTRFSTIDLPQDLPEEMLQDLRQVRVAGQALRISKWNGPRGGGSRFDDQPRKFNRKKHGKPTWKKSGRERNS